MYLLLQTATATATAVVSSGSSDSPDWRTIAAIAAPCIAAAGLLVAFLKNRKDLKNAEMALNDRRLDERIDAKFGQNMVTINGLMDRARSTLQEAEKSAATVKDISVEVQRINETILEQARQSEDSRQKLEEALRRADQVIEKLDQGARQADEDVEAISAARSSVARHEDLVEKVENSLNSHRYTEVLLLGFSLPGADLLAYGEEARPNLLIETKVVTSKTLYLTKRDGIGSLLRVIPSKSPELLASLNVSDYRFVVVIDYKHMNTPRLLPQILLDQAKDQNISIVRIEEFDRFLQDLEPLDSNQNSASESK